MEYRITKEFNLSIINLENRYINKILSRISRESKQLYI